MNRSKLRNKLLKIRNEESKRCFNHHRNFCVSLFRKTKRCIFFEKQTIDLFATIENTGKFSVLSFQRRLFTKNLLF